MSPEIWDVMTIMITIIIALLFTTDMNNSINIRLSRQTGRLQALHSNAMGSLSSPCNGPHTSDCCWEATKMALVLVCGGPKSAIRGANALSALYFLSIRVTIWSTVYYGSPSSAVMEIHWRYPYWTEIRGFRPSWHHSGLFSIISLNQGQNLLQAPHLVLTPKSPVLYFREATFMI